MAASLCYYSNGKSLMNTRLLHYGSFSNNAQQKSENSYFQVLAIEEGEGANKLLNAHSSINYMQSTPVYLKLGHDQNS